MHNGRQNKFCSGTQWGGNCPPFAICFCYKKFEERAWIFLPIPKMIQDFTNYSAIRSTCRRVEFTSCHTHQVLHNFPLLQFQGISHLLLALVGHCMQGMHIQKSNHTFRHIKQINLLKNKWTVFKVMEMWITRIWSWHVSHIHQIITYAHKYVWSFCFF